jgi:hypothetical protein
LRAWKSPVLSVLVVLETFNRSSVKTGEEDPTVRLRMRMRNKGFFMVCTPFVLKWCN